MPTLYRKRLIPEECIMLKDDTIIYNENDFIITSWKTLKPRKDFSHGYSLYDIHCGYKISKFFDDKNNFIYWYCDIISTDYDEEKQTYVFTDLLTDIIIYPDGSYKIVDLDELVSAHESGLLTTDELYDSLKKTNNLLKIIYDGDFKEYTDMIDEYI